jgi:hypothetical protein
MTEADSAVIPRQRMSLKWGTMLAQSTFFDGGAKPMARLQDGVRVPEEAEADYQSGSRTAETRVSDLGMSLQTLLTHLLLLLSLGLFSRRDWGPALIVLAVYIITLVFNAPGGHSYENDHE